MESKTPSPEYVDIFPLDKRNAVAKVTWDASKLPARAAVLYTLGAGATENVPLFIQNISSQAAKHERTPASQMIAQKRAWHTAQSMLQEYEEVIAVPVKDINLQCLDEHGKPLYFLPDDTRVLVGLTLKDNQDK